MIAATGLTKRYGSLCAVDDIDLAVHPGDIYGFLGANGSGKTTTVRMLLGLVLPTSGSIRLFDEAMPKAAHQVLPRVGALVEGPSAYRHLSGHTHLSLLDGMGPGGPRDSRRRRIADVLDQVGLAGVGSRPVKAYSLGMRQRLGLAGALLRSPELLILDEPTNGLDPQGIHEVRDLLLTLNRAGTTVFLSSHLLAEVEQLCTRVGVLDRGRVVLEETMDTLRTPSGRTVVHTPDIGRTLALLGDRAEQYDDVTVTVRAPDPAALNAELVQAGVRVSALAPERRSLEQIVLAATGPSADRVDA
ncbi:MAG: ABC transporter ATP-binding protein [Nocardioidaceae bacterium]|nr:ABC transporter ATP-binding protein [Nocardioidaceae bacterium]